MRYYDVCVKAQGKWTKVVTLKSTLEAKLLLQEAGLAGPNVCIAEVGGPTSSKARQEAEDAEVVHD